MIFPLILILTSPFSDHAKVAASNQYALPVLTYLMWTQTWPIANIQQLDQVGRKIVVENGGNHPKGSTAILFMSRKLGGSGLKSVENEYKDTKDTSTEFFSLVSRSCYNSSVHLPSRW